MINMRVYALGLSTLCLGTVGLIPVATLGQEENSAFTVGLSVGAGLRHEDDETSARTDLGLNLNTQTRNQSLRLNFDTAFDSNRDDTFDVQDPRFALDYALSNRNSELGANLSYSRVDIDDSEISLEDGDILVIDDGEREDLRAGISLALGNEAPFGATFSLNYAETNFISPDPGLIDSETLSGNIRLRFRLTPTISSFVALSGRELDRDGGTDVTRTALNTGLNIQVSPALTTNLSIGFSRVENDDGTTTTEETGANFGLGMTLDRPNGTLSGRIRSDIGENGRQTVFRLNRAMTLPRGSLRAGIGLSHNSETDSTDPLYDLNYSHSLSRSTLNAAFSQRVTTSTDGTETLASRLRLSVEQSLTELSTVSASFNIRDTNQLAGAGTDSRQYGLSLSYGYQLNKDWRLFGAYSRTLRQIDGQSDSTDDVISIGIRSSFTWRP